MSNKTRWDSEALRNFWICDEMANIKPANWGEFPEGFDPRKIIANLYDWIGGGAVSELGCGYGRLCGSFSRENYRGFDINPNAIKKAKELFPGYQFDVIEGPLDLPGGTMLLAYTLFLHMPDEVLIPWVLAAQERYQYIVVCEILGKEWRKTAAATPVFNRDLKEYVELLSPFTLATEIRMPYRRYLKSHFAAKKFNTNISFMVFARDGACLNGLACTEA